MWKKRYLSYSEDDHVVKKVQNPYEEQPANEADLKSDMVIAEHKKENWEKEIASDKNVSTNISRYSYRASIKAGTLLKDKVGSLIVTHIHGRPGMDQEQPLDLSVTKTNHKKFETPPDVQKMFPDLKQTNTGAMVLWNFLWAILENNHTNIAAWVSDRGDKKFKIVNPDLLAETWGTVKGTPGMQWAKIKKVVLYIHYR